MKKIFLYTLFLLPFAGCKKFENSNPNVPTVVHPGVMLPHLFFNISSRLVNSAWDLNNELIQYTCQNNTITEVQRFKLQPSNSDGIWSMYNFLRDINDVIRMSDEGTGLENYKAIAMIVRVFTLSIITDTYGDVPYSEAGRAASDKIYAAKYDNQKDIYTDMLAKLEEAAEIINVPQGLSLGGDIIFGGDMLKWKKFANSLRLRLLMRVSGKAEMNAPAMINEMLSNPSAYPVMEANADNVLYKYSGSLPDAWPLSLAITRDFDFKVKVVSAFIVDSMKKFNDTRLFQYARPTIASAGTNNPEYVGLPNSLSITESANYNGGFDFQSYLGTRFQNNNTEPAIWMTFSELLFLKAEAAMKGYYAADARQLYEQAIEASFEYWGAAFDPAYLQQSGVVYDGSEYKLHLQKFFALFFTGMEAWFEYRRTGYPHLVPGPTNVNGGKIPARLPYPLAEQSLNESRYKEAVSSMGGDDLNTKVWWQK